MSVAFTREDSAQTATEVELPDRPISPHPNLVTPAGVEALNQAMAAARQAFEASQLIEDINERRHAAAPAIRDIRYLTERLRSAQIIAMTAKADVVAFGHSVTFERDDGRQQTFAIVGEDEADPHKGSISYVSPMARALIGKAVGDAANVAGHEIEILAIG